jgi:outer membrane protein assembly factor BamA
MCCFFAVLLLPVDLLHAQVDPSYYDSVQVADIRFEGNATFADNELLLRLRTQETPAGLWVMIYENLGARFPFAQEPRYFDYQTFQDDVSILRQFYKNNGFYAATVEGSYSLVDSGQAVDLLLSIAEGPSSLVDSVAYRNLGPLPPEVRGEIYRSQILRPGRRYSADEIHAERTRILEILGNNGFPRASVDTILVERKLSNNNVIVKLTFNYGRRLYFGPVTEEIKGVDELNLARKIVYDRVEFKTGEIYSRSRQDDAETNLNRLGVFSYVAITPEFPKIENLEDSLVPLKLELEPRKRFEIAPGVVINNQLSGLAIGAEISFLMRNVFGGAQTLTTRFNVLGRIPNVTGTYLATSQLRFDQPYLFSNRNSGYLAGSYSLVGDEDLAEGSILQLVVGTERYLSMRSSAKLSWTYEISEFNGDAKVLLGKGYINIDTTETINFRNSIRSFSIEEDGTDDLFNPSTGYFLKGIVEEAGYLEQIGVSPLPQEDEVRDIRSTQYYKLEGLTKYFSDLSRNRSTIFGAKFRLGGIFRFGKSKEEGLPVPPNRRYYAGGASSVRGWVSRELAADTSAAFFGSNALLEISAEVRWHLFPGARNWLDGFWLVAFADAGNLWTEFTNIDLTQTALAIGFGIRYNLFFGPIRVDFGMKAFNPSLGEDRWFYEKNLWSDVVLKGVVQFGIGHAF